MIGDCAGAAELRAELAGLSGPARLPLLTRLGQVLADCCWRAGVRRPDALPLLDEAVAAVREAHGYLVAGDPVRGRVAALLGFLLSLRLVAHGTVERDREDGVAVLEEALGSPGIPAPNEALCRVMLAYLYVFGAMQQLRPQTLVPRALGEVGPGVRTAELDRAATLLRQVIERPVSPQVTEVAAILLPPVEALRDLLHLLSDGAYAVDLNRFVQVLTASQSVLDQLRRIAQNPLEMSVPGGLYVLFDGTRIADLDPLVRPVAQVVEAEVVDVDVRPSPAGVAATGPFNAGDASRRRDECVRALAGVDDGVSVWEAALSLLVPAAVARSVEEVDRLAAAAFAVVELRPDEDCVDRLVLAVALHLRARLDPVAGITDRQAGAAHLVAAAQRLPLRHAALVPTLAALGAFIDGTTPWDHAVGHACADRLDAVLASGSVTSGADMATLHALRCLARAVPGPIDEDARAELLRAIGTVPLEYPWLAELHEAATALRPAPTP